MLDEIVGWLKPHTLRAIRTNLREARDAAEDQTSKNVLGEAIREITEELEALDGDDAA